MKKSFLTGLALLLPAFLTLVILGFLVSFLTDPFVNGLEAILNIGRSQDIVILKNNALLLLVVRLIIVIALLIFVTFIGYLTQSFFNSYFHIIDEWIKKIPIINSLYKALQEVVNTLFSSNSNSFSQVVLVPYPNETSVSLGFITSNEATVQSNDEEFKNLVAVFVPGAPNPSVGFILIYPKEKITYVDMKVEEAFKLLVSCGIIIPSKKIIDINTKSDLDL